MGALFDHATKSNSQLIKLRHYCTWNSNKNLQPIIKRSTSGGDCFALLFINLQFTFEYL
jgi:hypothetical protein